MKACLLILTIISFTNSCSAQTAFSRVDSVLIFPPLTDIQIVRTGNNLEKDSGLSKKAANEVIKEVIAVLPDNISSSKLEISKDHKGDVLNAIGQVISQCEHKNWKSKAIEIPPILLDLLDSFHRDFGLCMFATGFTRTLADQSGQYQLSTAVTFFSLGNISYTSNNSYSTVVCFIIDKKNKKLKYYKKNKLKDGDPSEPLVLKSQVHHLIMSYFQNEK